MTAATVEAEARTTLPLVAPLLIELCVFSTGVVYLSIVFPYLPFRTFPPTTSREQAAAAVTTSHAALNKTV